MTPTAVIAVVTAIPIISIGIVAAIRGVAIIAPLRIVTVVSPVTVIAVPLFILAAPGIDICRTTTSAEQSADQCSPAAT
jgi:hypothetical protein